MALVPFAKPTDLLVLAPALPNDQATLLLDLVSATIRTSLGWDVDEATGIVYTQRVRPGSYLEAIVLPALNVTAIDSVVVDGTALTPQQYDATPAGVVYLNGILARKSAVVTYTAGWKREPVDLAPPVLRTVALDYAARAASNPGGVQSYTMGGTSETFGADPAEIADNDSRLDPYRVNL